jgi:hypothetical protein
MTDTTIEKSIDTDTKVPGIVVLRKILTLDEQLKLIDIVERKGGLKDSKGDWNFLNKRGRHFCGITKYPDDDCKLLQEYAKRFKDRAEELDSSLIWPDVTHLLTLWYPDSGGMSWHYDDYGGNNGDVGAPVYSLTIGNTCVFEYRLVGGDNSNIKIELNSGDLIVFGGPQRMMKHAVTSVKKGSFKDKEGFDARINLTFRTCSGFSEKSEEEYQTDTYVKKLQAGWTKKEEKNKQNKKSKQNK